MTTIFFAIFAAAIVLSAVYGIACIATAKPAARPMSFEQVVAHNNARIATTEHCHHCGARHAKGFVRCPNAL